MLTKRIIPCLDVRAGQVVKGVQFDDHQVVGDILALAGYYSDSGADELVFYDITASSDRNVVDRNWIDRVANRINIPFCVAGGIRSLDDAKRVLEAGADKISINSPALENPDLIDQLAAAFGQQCIVVGIDSQWIEGDYQVCQYTGYAHTRRFAKRRTLEWVAEVQDRGAGEIVLNCMNCDGVRKGYDLVQLKQVRRIATVPCIASGGAGKLSHFSDLFNQVDIAGALAASVFHHRLMTIQQLKQFLLEQGIWVRVVDEG